MNNWNEVYQSRILSVKGAINKVNSGDTIFLAAYCAEPQTLVEELVSQKKRLEGTKLYINAAGSPLLYAKNENLPFFQIRAMLSSMGLKGAMIQKNCDYLPVNLSDVPDLINSTNIDVALIQVSPPNEDGYFCLGISVEALHALMKKAKCVIAEVNDKMPVTAGETLVHVDQINYFIESSRPLLSIPERKLNDVEKKIGENVASLIDDGATIQWGIGNIPNSVLYALKNKKDLGVHTGSITDPIIDLIEAGVITNHKKKVKPGKIVCTTLLGTERLYKYVANNNIFEIQPVDFTHSISVIGSIDNFIAINSAIEIDIYGQINAESINNTTIAGVGGQMDFIRGARLSNGGKSIIAMPSTTKKAEKSRIRSSVERVTSLKSDIDYVVTEYGIAKLFGKSMTERAKELIAIAHPKFRKDLLKQL